MRIADETDHENLPALQNPWGRPRVSMKITACLYPFSVRGRKLDANRSPSTSGFYVPGMKFIVGRKLEMAQMFKEDGTAVPVTLVRAEPNVITQIRSVEKDGYAAVQVGVDIRRKLNRPEAGHVAGLASFGTLREFCIDNADMKRGDRIEVSVFEPGEKVDVIGVSKGRGFQGVVKRHHFHGSPASHGHKDQLRMPGSIGSRRQGPVAKGKRMAGHMGHARVTVKNLEVVSVDPVGQILAIRGAIPGARGSLVMIQTREGSTIWQK